MIDSDIVRISFILQAFLKSERFLGGGMLIVFHFLKFPTGLLMMIMMILMMVGNAVLLKWDKDMNVS